MRKVAILAALSLVSAFALVGSASATPEGPGGPGGPPKYEHAKHLVNVTKVVKNAPDGGASFVVNVCGQSLNFNANGGTQQVDVGSETTSCSVSEPDNGGASSVDISGSPCAFTVEEHHDYGKPSDVGGQTIEKPVYTPPADQVCNVTVTNTFHEVDTPDTTQPPVVVGPPVIVQAPAPQVIVATPNTTG